MDSFVNFGRPEILESENEELRKLIDTFRNQKNELQTSLDELRAEHNKMDSENRTLKETIEKLKNSKEMLKNENNDLLGKIDQINRENFFSVHLKKNLTEENDQLRNLLNDEKERVLYWKEQFESMDRDKNKHGKLAEKIAHFVEEVLFKKEDLPTLGDNNQEDIFLQKFHNFILEHAEKFREMAQDGFSGTSFENCKICNKKPQFVRCLSGGCGGNFHKECIQNWFKTKKACPCCNNDSVRIEENEDEGQP